MFMGPGSTWFDEAHASAPGCSPQETGRRRPYINAGKVESPRAPRRRPLPARQGWARARDLLDPRGAGQGGSPIGYGLFGWIIVGLVAGALAKAIHPGRDPGGLGVTLLVGIAGGILGGFAGRLAGAGPESTLLNLLLATGGALLLLVLWRALERRGRRR